jgi:serine/threonine protein kinase
MSDHSLQAPSPEDLAKLLPQYGIESFIAQGGMGAVYKGRQLSLDRDVAIKVLLYQFGEDTEFRKSFITEAKAMARLNHPNLLGVFDYGEVDGMPYLMMEYVEGGSLHEAAWNQALDPAQAVAIVKGICDGLAHAHEHHIVHRDIKPSNILLTPLAQPKVADFGLAHATDSDVAGLVMGTPGYTAPEVFQNPKQAGKLADIYSVGVIFHQLLTGLDPAGCLEPPSQVTGHPQLDLIWRKATHSNPALRYPSVSAMATDLEQWAASQKKVTVSTARVAPNRPLAPRRHVDTQSRKGGGGILVKVLLVGILAAVGLFTYQHLQKPKDSLSDFHETVAAETPPQPPIPAGPSGAAHPPEPVETHVPPNREPGTVSKKEERVAPPIVPPILNPGPETKPPADQNLPPGDPELQQRAIGLIADARKKRDHALADNANALISQLSNRARSAKKEEATLIEHLKADVTNNRTPLTEGVNGLPNELTRDFEQARSKEGTIDKEYQIQLTQVRDAYKLRLQKAAAESLDAELKRRLLAQAGLAANLDEWIALLAPETKIVPKKSIGSIGAAGFAGKWDFNVIRGKTSKWIAYPDGRFEESNDNRKITWKILPDGTLEVAWPNTKGFAFTRDGDGWLGKESNGMEITITRGNW